MTTSEKYLQGLSDWMQLRNYSNEMVLKNGTEKFDNFKSDERRKDKETEVPQV